MGKRIGHTDYRELAWDQNTTPLVKTAEGFLVGKACLTGVGVFSYKEPDGSIIRVLRPKDEVEKSVSGLNMKPITSKHPKEFVDADNSNKYTVGAVGTDVYFDGYNAYATISINDAAAVKAVEDKEFQALSCGYDCEREYTPGVWQGVEYDAIQRNIVYNHVALVEEGRAGDSVRLRIGVTDSMDDTTHKKEAHVALKKTTLDGVEREAEAEVIVALTHAKNDAKDKAAKIESLNTEISKLQGERDALKEEVKKAKSDDSAIQKAVDERVALLDTARKFGVETKDAKDASSIRKAVIGKAFPSMNLDGKDDSYLVAVFDTAKASLESSQNSTNITTATDSRTVVTVDSVDDARKKMEEGIFNPNKGAK